MFWSKDDKEKEDESKDLNKNKQDDLKSDEQSGTFLTNVSLG